MTNSDAEKKFATEIGERLVEIRGGRSQEQFAEFLAVHKNTIGRYERGEYIPDAKFLLALNIGLGIEPYWILTGDGPKTSKERAQPVDFSNLNTIALAELGKNWLKAVLELDKEEQLAVLTLAIGRNATSLLESITNQQSKGKTMHVSGSD